MTMQCVGGLYLNLMGSFPFGPKANEPLAEDPVGLMMLVVEANPLHHRDALIIATKIGAGRNGLKFLLPVNKFSNLHNIITSRNS